MKFGVRVGMLDAPFEQAHEVAARLGFDGVELEVGPDAGERGSPLFDPGEREALVERMYSCGVPTSCVCVGAFWRYGPAEPDASVRRTGAELLRQTIEACAEIGTGFILTPLNDSGQGPDVAVGRWLEFLQHVAPLAEERGVTLALEPCARPGMGTDREAMALADSVGSPRVRVYLDVANIRMAGVDSVQAVRTLGQRYLAHVHMKDLRENPPGGERRFQVVGIGKGMLDFPAICRALREVGYDGWLTLETPSDGEPRESAKRNLEALKAACGGA